MKIGIDIDDTIAEFSEETDIWAKEYTEKILHREFTLSNIEIYDPISYIWDMKIKGIRC